MKQGNCKLCTKFGKLTYEHVPPRVTSNKKTRFRTVNFIEYITNRNPLNYKPRGRIEQGGVGYYSLCSECNSFLGGTYITDYQKYSNTFIDLAKKKEFNSFELTMHEFNGLYVLKQILSMFFSINDQKFSEKNRDLAEFILDPNSNNLPERFRVFNYINTEGQLRNLPLMALGNWQSGGVVLGSELAFPPLGHVLAINFQGTLPFHQEVTAFIKCQSNSKISFDFKIFRLPTHLPILLDYRDKRTIEMSIEDDS